MKSSMMLDSLWVLATRFVMRAANFVVFLLLARGLTQAEFGTYGYVVASILMLSVVFDVGLRQSIGLSIGEGGRAAEAVVTQMLLLWLVLAVAGSIAMVAIATFGGPSQPLLLLVLGVASLAPAMLIRMGQGVFLGSGRMACLNRSELIGRAVLLVGTLALWSVSGLTIASALMLLLASYLSAAGFLLWQLRDLLGRARPDLALCRTLLRRGLGFAGGIVAMILLGRVGIWIVNAQLDAADVGAYFAIMRLAEMVAEVATAVGVVIFNHGVRAVDAEAAALATVRTARGVTALMAVIGCGAALFAEPLLSLAVGPAYVAHADAFRLMLAGAVVSCFSMMLYPGLSSRGDARYGFWLFAPGAVLAGLLCWWAAPIWGVAGAAFAAAAAQAAVALGFILTCHKVFALPIGSIVLPQIEDIRAVGRLLGRRTRLQGARA